MKDIVNSSEDSEFTDDSSQSLSPENISRPISLENEENYCSEAASDRAWHMHKSINSEASYLLRRRNSFKTNNGLIYDGKVKIVNNF